MNLTTLNTAKDVDVVSLAPKLTYGGVSGAGGGQRKEETKRKAYKDLRLSVQVARKLLSRAIDSRWFNMRYSSKEEAEDTGFLLDMHIALHPTTATLGYVEHLSPNLERAAEVISWIGLLLWLRNS